MSKIPSNKTKLAKKLRIKHLKNCTLIQVMMRGCNPGKNEKTRCDNSTRGILAMN